MIICREDVQEQEEQVEEEYDYMNEPALEDEEFEYEEDERDYCD